MASSGVKRPTEVAAATPFEQSFNRIVRQVRDGLLKYGGDAINHKSVIQNIFSRVDENNSGIVSVQEMKDFILSAELSLFDNNAEDSSQNEKFCDLMLEQIDMNRYNIHSESLKLIIIYTYVFAFQKRYCRAPRAGVVSLAGFPLSKW